MHLLQKPMQKNRQQTHQKLIEILGQENGYFGRVFNWGEEIRPYSNIGFEFTEDFDSTLCIMTDKEHDSLKRIMTYFELHMRPLKNMLSSSDYEHRINRFSTEIAWSHFSTVIMFGMLEIAVKGGPRAGLDGYGNLKDKGRCLRDFLDQNLPEETKRDITSRYSNRGTSLNERSQSFITILDHLWREIRSGFIHEGSIHSIGLENIEFSHSAGTREDPIKITSNVPMYEWLQMTWQAILNSYGYTGKLVHPRIIPKKSSKIGPKP